MEDYESDENAYNTFTLFPLRETLYKLYLALLVASSYHNQHEYYTFDIDDKQNSELTRSKARVIFSEFDITGYEFDGKFKRFEPPLNSSVHLHENLDKIIKFLNSMDNETENSETGKSECECGTEIVHMFEVTSRITKKKVFPVGRICIMKFLNTDTLAIMKEVSRVITKHACSKAKKDRQMELALMRLEDKPPILSCKKRKQALVENQPKLPLKRATKTETAELKAMRMEDKVVRRKKAICNYDCPCKLIAAVNSFRLDPLLFNIRKINSKPYMNDYMKALGLVHSVTYV